MENTECKSLGSNSKSMWSIQINLQLSIRSCSLSDPSEKLTYKGNDGTVLALDEEEKNTFYFIQLNQLHLYKTEFKI